ncbi:hypothetical protein EDC96DRAFT_451243 [Choanephora cucurbitarum]|nr:hypothetical protein EDC96DRAFT_451243 [Choanephora cucurbitarum]
MERPNKVEAYKRKRLTRINPANQQPRWHNQSYMLFLALRQHSGTSMARTDLIKSALALDKKISEERSLPKVFRGKTPMNSASAILTNNSDRYFVAFKPEGSRSMHFKLSFEPGNFDSAFCEYKEWQNKLAHQDWPFCFQTLKRKSVMSIENLVQDLQVEYKQEYPTEFDEFIANRRRARLQPQPTTNKYVYLDNNGAIEEHQQQKKDIEEDIEGEEVDSPKSWHELISLSDGLRAKRKLPKNIPLGFYFGVPMTEDEFDSLKDGIGKASEMAVMYRKTVIDPTDSQGEIYVDPSSGEPLCPFHYIRETSIRDKANITLYEGDIVNQIVCWTKREINENEELLVYSYATELNTYQNTQQEHPSTCLLESNAISTTT